MTRYLISFDDGAMTFPEEELPAVAEASHKVVQEAKNAGVWVFGGGVASQRASVVATDGMVTGEGRGRHRVSGPFRFAFNDLFTFRGDRIERIDSYGSTGAPAKTLRPCRARHRGRGR
jgi:hypothetical protein